MLKKTGKASFTIEAACILPLILFIIVAFLYLGMDLHDYICIETMLDQYGTRAQDTIRVLGKQEVEHILEKDIEQKIQARLCITSLKNIKVTVGVLHIHIEYGKYRNLSLPGIERLLGKKTQWKKKEIIIYNPMESIRGVGGFFEDDSGV